MQRQFIVTISNKDKKTQQNNTSNIKHNESGRVPYIQSLLLFYGKKSTKFETIANLPFLFFTTK